MAEQLLDREIETNEILEILNKPADNNKIIYLTGISGVGKTGFVKKLSQSSLLTHAILSVKISKSSVETIENLQYFNALYKTVTYYAKNKMFDSVLSPAQQNMRSIKSLRRVFFSIFKSKSGLSDMEPLSEPAEDASVVRKKDYLIYVLKKNDIIIDIENIQNVDTQSLELIKDIIYESQNRTFIFEYTLTNSNYSHFENQYKEFREICSDISCYKIEKMDFLIAKNLAPADINIDIEEVRMLYEKSNGNLMEIILANEHSNESESNINTNIKKLSKKEKYILFIIFLNDAPIEYDDLAVMVIENDNEIRLDFEELKSLINILCQKKILIKENDIIKIKHDSIIDALQMYMQSPILYCAYITLKNYYNDNLETKKISIEKLLSLYLRFSDQDLLILLPRIKEFVLDMKYPDLIIEKLDLFRNQILHSSANGFYGIYSLTQTIVEICLYKKMGNIAQKNLDLIYDDTNAYHIALQAQIYSLQETMAAHDALCDLVQGLQEGSRLKLICEICFLYLKMKLLPAKSAKKYGEKLINNELYPQYIEYAYLLRNYAELSDDTEECRQLYGQALDRFKSKKMYHDMAAVYLSLSMITAYIGDIAQSRQYIEDAIKLDSRELSLCYILNNKSVLELLDNTYSNTTEKNLRNALLLCVSRYEKLIVNANLLIFYCLTNNFSEATRIANIIEESNYLDFQYEEFLHIIYQNLYYYYDLFKHNNDKRQYYYDQILNLVNSPKTKESTKFLASGMNHLIKTDYFYAQFPFRADFLGYWEFTVDSDLSC